jgi:AraC family transcriptional regulator
VAAKATANVCLPTIKSRRKSYRSSTMNNHAEIQGNVVRTEMLGQFRLTESYYRPGLRIGTHAHRCAVFGFILDGFLGQKSELVDLNCPGGSVFYNPPEVPHTNLVNQLGARCMYMEIPPDWLSRSDAAGAPPRDPAIWPNPRVQSVARRIYAEWLAKDDVTPLMMEGLACELVTELFRARVAVEGPQAPPWLDRLYELLRNNFIDPPRLSQLSAEAGVHQVHVARQFRKYYGLTIGEFVRQTRVEFARNRLRNSDTPIVEIALEAGFAHQSHFTTVFKKLMGVTPRQYCAAVGNAHRRKP